MHAYGIGYGAALAGCTVGWLIATGPAPAVGATPPWVRLSGIFLLVTLLGWLLVALWLRWFPNLGADRFRAADPRGFAPAGAGLLAGLAASGAVALLSPLAERLVPVALGVQRDEGLPRDVVLRWMLLPYLVVFCAAAVGGAAVCLRVCRAPHTPGSP